MTLMLFVTKCLTIFIKFSFLLVVSLKLYSKIRQTFLTVNKMPANATHQTEF